VTGAADNVMARSPALRKPRLGPLVASLCLWLAATACVHAQEGWIEDKNGCRIANPNPKAGETVIWSGACTDGFAAGEGTMQWYEDGKLGVRYEGSLAKGAPSGQGKLTMPGGATYEGGWLSGKQDGSGKYSAPDGTTYEGEWKDGVPEGRGVMRNASGEATSGIWKGGTYVGPAPQQ
jgi:hypothetical protein